MNDTSLQSRKEAQLGLGFANRPERRTVRRSQQSTTSGDFVLRQKGFTLIELMVVIAVIVIIAAIAIPNLLSARLTSNETAAMSVLKTLHTAQQSYANAVRTDDNGNGVGEYGTFLELATADPGYLSGSFANISGGVVSRSGYRFAIYLPNVAGLGVAELGTGGRDSSVDPDASETHWVAYAWPNDYGRSGRRTFFVSQSGDIMTTDFASYSGSFAPSANAAMLPGHATITGNVAVGSTGFDGLFWKNAQ